MSESQSAVRIRKASRKDVPIILSFMRELARYEGLLRLVVATQEKLTTTLFARNPEAEVLIQT